MLKKTIDILQNSGYNIDENRGKKIFESFRDVRRRTSSVTKESEGDTI